MGHVFISYAREDRAKVSALAAALEHAGLSVWMDERLVAGDHFDLAIEEALAASDRVIVAWSPASFASRWVRAEAGDGLERRILVPVMIEHTPIPLEFRRVQTVDLTDWDGSSDSEGLNGLIAALSPTECPRGTGAARKPPSAVVKKKQKRAKRHQDRDGETPSVSTNALRATKYWGSNFRFRLRVGSRSIPVQHVDLMLVHWLSVDGRRVSRRSWLAMPDYYEFFVDTPHRKLRAELTLSSDGIMLINDINLIVDDQEVLHHQVRWRDGAVSALAIMLGGIPFVLWALTAALE